MKKIVKVLHRVSDIINQSRMGFLGMNEIISNICILQASVHCILKHANRKSALTEDDHGRIVEFCERYLRECYFLNKIFRNDEISFQFNDSLNQHSCTYYTSNIPQVTQERNFHLSNGRAIVF